MSEPEPVRPLLLGMGWFPDERGGLNRYFRSLFEALRAEGVDARAVVVGPVSEEESDVDAVADARLPLVGRVRAFARAAAAAAPAVDVVDAHFALYALAAVALGPLRHKPLVVHFHGPWADEVAVAGDTSALRRRVRHAIERAFYVRADVLVTLSEAFRTILVERYGVSPWRITAVPPGVDLDRFGPADRAGARRRLGIGEHGFVAVTARRLSPRMGLDVLLEAWARLDGERLLVVAGDGPLRGALSEQVRSLGIDGNVRFLGAVEDDVLADCYRAADLCVVPSVALEGFGLTVLEALACGTPVVGTDAGGLPEVLRPLDHRLVVPAGDVTALAARLSDRESLPLADGCRRHAECFSWAAAARRNLELYERARSPPPARRLRVVFLDHTARLSGGELALARLLPALDVDAHVILGEDGPLAARLRAAGASVEVLDMTARAREVDRRETGAGQALGALAAMPYALRVARRLRCLQPDLVHTNSLKAALYGGVAARLAGVPAVWHVRDRIADDYLSPRNVRLVRALARRLPAAIVANSASTLATLGELSVPAEVVPSPVTVGASPRRHEGPLRIGMVGRIAPWKGQHVFLDAFAAAFPDGDERAVVVGVPLFGAEEEEYFADLRRRVAELGIEERVEFAGFREDVEGELARFDLLVHASVVPEPLGQVVLEGMAAGLPVVAAAAGGPAELIEDGVEGLLYPPRDVPALAAALRRLAADPGARERLGRLGRARAREFAPERVAPRIMELYRRIASTSSTAMTGQSNLAS